MHPPIRRWSSFAAALGAVCVLAVAGRAAVGEDGAPSALPDARSSLLTQQVPPRRGSPPLRPQERPRSGRGAQVPGAEEIRPDLAGPRGRRMEPGELPGRYPFYWTRAIYSGPPRFRWGESWAIDYPKGDQQFIVVLKRLVRIHAYDWDNAVRLDDPNLRRFPVLYAVEVGGMNLTDAEVEGLRGYLQAGGFLIVDDFWGEYEWAVFEYNMRRVFPDRPIVRLGLDHPVFSAFYTIDEVKQVPARGRGIFGRPTTECYGCYPEVRGIFDEKGRLMVIINWNTDLGDAWEWAEDPYYPLEYSTYAYEMGANMIIYAMTH